MADHYSGITGSDRRRRLDSLLALGLFPNRIRTIQFILYRQIKINMKEKDYLISPSILSADFTKLGDQIKRAEQAGADWFHVDVMDGHFVPNISMGPFIVEACRRATDLPLDVHLMIEKPERYLEKFASCWR